MNGREDENLSREEREFFERRDADGRIFTDNRDRSVIESLQRKGLIEQNVFYGSCYWDRRKRR